MIEDWDLFLWFNIIDAGGRNITSLTLSFGLKSNNLKNKGKRSGLRRGKPQIDICRGIPGLEKRETWGTSAISWRPQRDPKLDAGVESHPCAQNAQELIG